MPVFTGQKTLGRASDQPGFCSYSVVIPLMRYTGFQLEVMHDRILGGVAAMSAGQVAKANAHLMKIC